MMFKVKDLMTNVAPGQADDGGVCPFQSWTGVCGGSLFDNAQRARHELSLLKAQLRRSAARA